MKKKCVIFDLDGTLIDSLSDVLAAINLTLAEHDLPHMSRENVRQMIGPNAGLLITTAVEGTGLDRDAFYDRFRFHYYKRLTETTTLYSGMREILDFLKEKEVLMGVLTNKPERSASLILNELQVMSFFELVIYPETLNVIKPDPRGLIHMMKQMAVSPDETLYIGDTQIDIETAKGANVDVVALSTGYRTQDELSAHTPRYLVASIEELAQLIETLV